MMIQKQLQNKGESEQLFPSTFIPLSPISVVLSSVYHYHIKYYILVSVSQVCPLFTSKPVL